MIVNHSTGEIEQLRTVMRTYSRIVAEGSELIGTIDGTGKGYRTKWDRPEPTDAQLRTVGYSYADTTEPPPNSVAAPLALVDDVWTQQWTPITDDELRARIVAQIKAAAGEHIRAVLPDWKQSNMHALAQEMSEVRETREMTPAETLQHQALLASWAWAKSVRAASDVAEADAALMDRAALDAWTMPALPEWPA